MDQEVEDALKKLKEIKVELYNGFEYCDAQRKAIPLLEVLNKKGKEIADKYGRRYYPIIFSKFMR